jgi:hypothetical protein
MARIIGTLAEKSLHAALKAHYAQPGDLLETALDGYVIDILRPADEGAASPYECIEIQTRSVAKMKPKLLKLLDKYPIRVVHPVAQERFVIRIDVDGVIVSRRKSPMRGTVYHVFPELVSLPTLIQHPNFLLEVLLIREEQIWLDDGLGSWRRKHWSIHDRRLLEVGEAVRLSTVDDFAALLPPELEPEFDTGTLAKALKQQRPLARQMAYCLRAMGVIELCGKRGKSYVYRKTLSNGVL